MIEKRGGLTAYAPSQYASPSISTAWKRNGRQVEASTASTPISELSKTLIFHVRTLVAARDSLIGQVFGLSAAKSPLPSRTCRSGFRLSGLNSYGENSRVISSKK